jgi:hypothetical protein
MALIQDHLPQPDYASQKVPLIALQVFLVLLALIFYGLRIYTRARILHSIGTDDWLMGVALVSLSLPLLVWCTHSLDSFLVSHW